LGDLRRARGHAKGGLLPGALTRRRHGSLRLSDRGQSPSRPPSGVPGGPAEGQGRGCRVVCGLRGVEEGNSPENARGFGSFGFADLEYAICFNCALAWHCPYGDPRRIFGQGTPSNARITKGISGWERVCDKIISPTHKRAEGRAPVWGSEFTSKDAALQGGSAKLLLG
jgi:hypothetical protein